MKRRVNILSVLVLVLAIAKSINAQEAFIPELDINLVSEKHIEQVKNHLILSEKRAKVIRPLAGTIGAAAGLGFTGYALYSCYKYACKPTTPPTPAGAPIDPAAIAPLIAHLQAEQNMTWYYKAYKGIMDTIPWFIAVSLGQKFVSKVIDTATTGGLSVDHALDYFITNRSLEWFKEQRTTFDISLADLITHLKEFLRPELKTYDQGILAEQLAAFQQVELEQTLSEEEQEGMEQLKRALEKLEAMPSELTADEEMRIRERIATDCSIFICQVEKVLGFIAYIQATAANPLARISAAQIGKSIRAITNQLRLTIVENIATDKNKSLSFLGQVNAHVTKLKQEIESFKRVDDLLEDAQSTPVAA